MATHEQLSSTSSRPPLDPTITGTTTNTVNIGTRRSKLALIQAQIVHDALKAAHPDTEFKIHAMATMGDKNQVTPLHSFGAKSLWTFELVHGLLDGCKIGAITSRENARDVVVMKPSLPYKSIAELPAGSVVGTSSVRRIAQIARKFPSLKFKDVRGNLGTRLEKLDAEDGEYACLILAAAGLERVGLADRITQHLDSKTPGGGILHAVGQGALGIEIRSDDAKTQSLLTKLIDNDALLACLAERSLLRTLEGGCSVPIGVETEWVEKGKLLMRSIVVSLDGTEAVEAETLAEVLTKMGAEGFGLAVAQDLIAKGASNILQAINLTKDVVVDGPAA
ncbi:porphobilinogen deaminase [Pseudogymnoascus sp. 24MN13]|nr:porphobilinogen deaminase [Pseudogymnoascus sp. 24MN13]